MPSSLNQTIDSHLWDRVGSRETGQSHVVNGQVCEDALCAWPDKSIPTREAFVAGADGHGHDLYCRAHIGSFLAVNTARDVCGYYAQKYKDEPVSQRLLNFWEEKAPKMIVEKWLKRVRRQVDYQPLQPAEFRKLSNAEVATLKDSPHKAFGTTLLTATATKHWLALARIGDGLVVVCDDNGNLTLPFGEQDELDEATHSLSESNAAENFEVRLISHEEKPPAMVLICTDGYYKSCGKIEDFLPVVSQLFEYAKTHSMLEFSETVDASLAHRAKIARDDLTFGILIRSDITKEK